MLGDSQILVTPPPYSAHTACSPLPTTGVYAGEGTGQRHLPGAGGRARRRRGERHAADPRAVRGRAQLRTGRGAGGPSGLRLRGLPRPTEFDYAPAPTDHAPISTSAGAGSLASETGGTRRSRPREWPEPLHARLRLVRGDRPRRSARTGDAGRNRGLRQRHRDADRSAGAGRISAKRPPSAATSVPLLLRTLAGESVPTSVQYAGVPRVSGVENTASAIRLEGHQRSPRHGRHADRDHRQGHARAGHPRAFHDSQSPPSEGTNFTFNATGNTRLSTNTVVAEPGARGRAGVHRDRVQRHIAVRPAVPVPARQAGRRSGDARLGQRGRRHERRRPRTESRLPTRCGVRKRAGRVLQPGRKRCSRAARRPRCERSHRRGRRAARCR